MSEASNDTGAAQPKWLFDVRNDPSGITRNIEAVMNGAVVPRCVAARPDAVLCYEAGDPQVDGHKLVRMCVGRCECPPGEASADNLEGFRHPRLFLRRGDVTIRQVKKDD